MLERGIKARIAAERGTGKVRKNRAVMGPRFNRKEVGSGFDTTCIMRIGALLNPM